MSSSYLNICKIIGIGCICIIFTYIYWAGISSTGTQHWREIHRTRSLKHLERSSERKFISIKSDKWIVVTTIAAPTPDIRFLAKIPGWKLLVVGDTKTPSDWRLSNCVYISIEDQDGLGFETVSHLPERSYSRKTAGYLFAIAHGAKVIYETDDDNRPVDLLQNFILTSTMWGLLYSGKHLFNPYRHFGQPTLWPRGYPLASVGEEIVMDYTMGHWKTPSIQQGVVNGDPDMDAIFRLTRKKTLSALNVTFDSRAPPSIVPAGVFSPFNSQNTLFLYDALWALLIPTTTTFRVCDIWRGYWAQRLLWEMGGTLGFFPPNAFQKRNSHSYLLDAIDEKDLYFQTERLVKFLTEWTCNPAMPFFSCLIKLSTDMASQHFWGKGEVTLAKAWIKDLTGIGYQEPKRIPFGSLINGAMAIPDKPFPDQKRKASMVNKVAFWAFEQNPPLKYTPESFPKSIIYHIKQISSYCKDHHFNISQFHNLPKIVTFPNILLVVVFNYPHYQNIAFLETMYGLHFPHTVYCGAHKRRFDKYWKRQLRPVTFLEVNVGGGWFTQNCLTQAMKMNYNVDGYLYIADDTLLNVWNIQKLPIDKLWLIETPIKRKNQTGVSFSNPLVGYQTYLKAVKSLNRLDNKRMGKFIKMLTRNTGHDDALYKRASDIAYIPSRLREDAILFLEHFSRYNLFVELAIPTVFGGIEKSENIIRMPGHSLWGKDRKHIETLFNEDNIFMHPVKINKELKLPKGRKFYCEIFLPLTLKIRT